MKLFKENIAEYFKIIFTGIENNILKIDEDKFLEYDTIALAKIIWEESKLSHLEIDLDNRFCEIILVDVPAEKFPDGYDVYKGEKYECVRVDYKYNLPKHVELLSYEPNGFRLVKNIEGSITDDKLVIHHQTFCVDKLDENDKNNVRNAMIIRHQDIKKVIEYINIDIENFNNHLKQLVSGIISERQNEIIDRKNLSQDLNNFN